MTSALPFGRPAAAPWDLTALLNAADPRASTAERHLWLIRLSEWLRHTGDNGDDDTASRPPDARPRPLLRLTHLLNVLERHPAHRARVAALLGGFWREIDASALFADFGFAPRAALWHELGQRVLHRLLPRDPASTDGAELFALLFPRPGDAEWLRGIDDTTLARIGALLGAEWREGGDWREEVLDAATIVAGAIRASGDSAPLRRRMDRALVASRPFRALTAAAERVREAVESRDRAGREQAVTVLHAMLDACRRAAASIAGHLEEHGVSVDIVFEVEQLQARCDRLGALVACLASPEPGREMTRLLADLARLAHEQRSVRALFARQYSLLARKVAERHAETGEHYITRNLAEYTAMLRKAAGGGAVMAATVFVKFAVVALGFGAFWTGVWAGVNYALSFVAIHLLHWTVATKQPAMTAPALAAKLRESGRDESLEPFVDEVAHLVRSQVAGIVGNLVAVAPLVLAVQMLAWGLAGAPLAGRAEAEYVLHANSLLGPTLLFAAFTGVLLFASSLVAGWAENLFVFHRLDSAIAWNPRIVAWLGQSRAQRWGRWWRDNVSGLAANVSLGLMLGLVPALLGFVGVPLDVRHVTLVTGQIAAAFGSLGGEALHRADFWWCVAAIPFVGALNLAVSFALAFHVALRSRDIRLKDRARVYAAIRGRMLRRPFAFLLPPR